MKLELPTSQLLVVDIQEKLAPAMAAGIECVAQAVKLLRCAERLRVPITITQQYPKGIGQTLAPVLHAAGAGSAIFDKLAFSAQQDSAIAEHVGRLADGGRDQIVICGIEAHVCVLQTALDLISAGRRVAVVTDAIASRAPESREIALRRLERNGAELISVEMAVFEWLGAAGTDQFRALLPLLK